MNTATLPKKLNKEVKAFIFQAVQEVLSDPDFGLALSTRAKKRLREVPSSRQKTKSFSAIKREYY